MQTPFDVYPEHEISQWEKSSSQVADFLRCGRRWAWKKIAGIDLGAGAGAGKGTKVHYQIETFYRGGEIDTMTEEGQIAMAGYYLLPPRRPDNRIEEEFKILLGRHVFKGKKDLEPAAGGVTVHGERIAIVYDWKTTSDFRFALTGEKDPTKVDPLEPEEEGKESLESNIQSALYMAESFARLQVHRGRPIWIYFRTKKPYKAMPVVQDVTWGSIRPTLQRAIEAADQMDQIRESGAAPLQLKPNPYACSDYGGCPYQHLCNLSNEERLRALMTQQAPSNQTEAYLAAMASQMAPGAPGAVPQSINPAQQQPPAGTPPTPPGQQPPPAGWAYGSVDGGQTFGLLPLSQWPPQAIPFNGQAPSSPVQQMPQQQPQQMPQPSFVPQQVVQGQVPQGAFVPQQQPMQQAQAYAPQQPAGTFPQQAAYQPPAMVGADPAAAGAAPTTKAGRGRGRKNKDAAAGAASSPGAALTCEDLARALRAAADALDGGEGEG